MKNLSQTKLKAMYNADERLFESEMNIRRCITDMIKDPGKMQTAIDKIRTCVQEIVSIVGEEAEQNEEK